MIYFVVAIIVAVAVVIRVLGPFLYTALTRYTHCCVWFACETCVRRSHSLFLSVFFRSLHIPLHVYLCLVLLYLFLFILLIFVLLLFEYVPLSLPNRVCVRVFSLQFLQHTLFPYATISFTMPADSHIYISRVFHLYFTVRHEEDEKR